MWSIWGKTNLFVFTANGVIKKGNSLVMGRGMAKQVKEKVPHVARNIAAIILSNHNAITDFDPETSGFQSIYSLAIDERSIGQPVGAFQVKYHFRSLATPELIKSSSISLFQWIIENLDRHPTGIRVDMNYPGIGNGGLTKAQVKPIISLLPACVHIWEKAYDPQLTFMDIPNA
jgi:hypothetical protein